MGNGNNRQCLHTSSSPSSLQSPPCFIILKAPSTVRLRLYARQNNDSHTPHELQASVRAPDAKRRTSNYLTSAERVAQIKSIISEENTRKKYDETAPSALPAKYML
eukprot:9500451-Pyramimonas_sp.AAC.2